jgi:hypothetical protein
VIRTLENTLKRFSFNNLQISLDRERTQSYLLATGTILCGSIH